VWLAGRRLCVDCSENRRWRRAPLHRGQRFAEVRCHKLSQHAPLRQCALLVRTPTTGPCLRGWRCGAHDSCLALAQPQLASGKIVWLDLCNAPKFRTMGAYIEPPSRTGAQACCLSRFACARTYSSSPLRTVRATALSDGGRCLKCTAPVGVAGVAANILA
jgi:hypothetical protein